MSDAFLVYFWKQETNGQSYTKPPSQALAILWFPSQRDFLELLGEVIVTYWISFAVSWKQAGDLEERIGCLLLVPALNSGVKVSGHPSRSTVTRGGLERLQKGPWGLDFVQCLPPAFVRSPCRDTALLPSQLASTPPFSVCSSCSAY